MPSTTVHKVAGTFIPPSKTRYTRTMAWIRQECLEGRLAPHVRKFCEDQMEMLEVDKIELRQVTDESIRCSIPCCVAVHESNRTFVHEVRFDLDPLTGDCRRLDVVG